MKLPPEALEQALQPWVEGLLEGSSTDELQAVAMDGKSLCGALAEHGRAVHMLSLLDQSTGFTLRQLEVPGKTNEHKTALVLLKSLVLQGRVVTGDALFCQHDLCEQIVRDEGHYFFEVKDNQPELRQAIEAEFHSAFSPLHRAAARGAFVGCRDA